MSSVIFKVKSCETLTENVGSDARIWRMADPVGARSTKIETNQKGSFQEARRRAAVGESNSVYGGKAEARKC
jgi:hypothetical protein